MNLFFKKIIPVLLLWGFVLLNARISQLSAAVQWVAFFPIPELEAIGSRLRLAHDYLILFVLVLGMPLVLLFWLFLISLFTGRFGRRFRDDEPTLPFTQPQNHKEENPKE